MNCVCVVRCVFVWKFQAVTARAIEKHLLRKLATLANSTPTYSDSKHVSGAATCLSPRVVGPT
jgi:hypothetical protein